MTILYIECVGGASGDMLLGALADVGVSQELLSSVVGALRLPNCQMHFDRVMRGSISATKATVTSPKQGTPRLVGDLISVVENADIPTDIKRQTKSILQKIAEVEASIHNEKVEDVHLHELGGEDTLIDIVGVLLGVAELKPTRILVSALPLGHGFTKSAHGLLPLPAPATLALLKDALIRYVDVEAELVTPTGAALLAVLADSYGGFPPMTLRKVGCGAGARDLPIPNILRLWVGDPNTSGELIAEGLVSIETNIDDMNPQVYEYVMERLYKSGALDVGLIPILMKKNRPATLLSVLCQMDIADELTRIILEETTSLGIRRQMVERISLPRRIEKVDTPYGPIRIKVARLPSGKERRTPEYQDCSEAAGKHGIPLMQIYEHLSRYINLEFHNDQE